MTDTKTKRTRWCCYGYGVIRTGTCPRDGYPPGKIPYVVRHVEKQADRDLIAAAPEMFAALNIAASAFEIIARAATDANTDREKLAASATTWCNVAENALSAARGERR